MPCRRKTHHDVLGVRRQADDEAIRAAYRKAAKIYHPDLNVGDPAAEQHVKQIIAAYEVLRNPKQRAAYDQHLHIRRQQNARRFLRTALASAGLRGDRRFRQGYRNRCPQRFGFSHRAKAWGEKGDLDRALADFAMAIGIDPTSASIFRDRGLLWRRNGASDRALVDFDQAIRLGFSDAAAYNERGQVWLERGHYERAIADFNRAIKIDPSFAGAYANRAFALRSKGDVERASADLNHAVRLDPSVSLAHRDVAPNDK